MAVAAKKPKRAAKKNKAGAGRFARYMPESGNCGEFVFINLRVRAGFIELLDGAVAAIVARDGADAKIVSRSDFLRAAADKMLKEGVFA